MGGNIFTDKTKGIKKENIEITVQNYFDELKRLFPKKASIFNKKHYQYLGSVGKKDISGDIDFGIDIKDIMGTDTDLVEEELFKWNLSKDVIEAEFAKLKKRARTATDSELRIKAVLKGIATYINDSSLLIYCEIKKVGKGTIFAYFPQYSSAGQLDYGVQIDWMVSDMKLLKFSYYSAVYKGNVKGLHRTQLILSMLQNLNYSFNHTKGLTDKLTGEFVTKEPGRIVQKLEVEYERVFTEDCINDYFCLMKIVNTLDKSDRDNILNIYLKILDHTRTDVPENIQSEWLDRKEDLGLKGKFLPESSKLYKYKDVECQV